MVQLTDDIEGDETEWTDRQKAVLDAVLSLLVESGAAVTMGAVARRASCSKETLYKWFGDRDGLLTATVQWQAAQVHVAGFDPATLDREALERLLSQYAVNWLRVICGTRSIALNRIAIGHAVSAKSSLGRIVLDNGRVALGRRMAPILEAGRSRGLVAFEDPEEAFRTFFGLIARDIQIRLLLGDRFDTSDATLAADATRATHQFLVLYRAEAPDRTRPRVRHLD